MYPIFIIDFTMKSRSRRSFLCLQKGETMFLCLQIWLKRVKYSDDNIVNIGILLGGQNLDVFKISMDKSVFVSLK